LKKEIPFIWDELSQRYFDALKHVLTNVPLLHPLDYQWDYFIYLAASDANIDLVLVQEDHSISKHVIYYMSRNLTKIEMKNAHVEKLAFEVVQDVQHFHHYILL